MNQTQKLGKILTQPGTFFYTLIWLMVLLVVGTIAQKYIGLYRAQQMYFSSLIFWWGPVPLPGGIPTMGLILINLLGKLIFASPWTWKNSGIMITHMGALLLLLGGLLTAVYSYEGSMLIYENTSSDFFSDYHQRELVVFDAATQETVVSFDWKKLKPGHVLNVPNLDFTIEPLTVCRNCDFLPQPMAKSDPRYQELRGRTKNFLLTSKPLEKDDEKNQGGVVFRVKGTGTEKDGIHMSVDFIDVFPWVMVDGETYSIALRRKRTYLPFKIKLLDFERKYHPGTEIPSSFKSDIILIDGDSEWKSIVQMNEPLRYKGFTFYQASFIDTGEVQATVFAVVKNAGRMFPYIASIIMCVGLLIHMFIHLPKLIRKE